MDEHIFVIRIWLERQETEEEGPTYRGMIRNEATGEKQYINDLSTISAILHPFVAEEDDSSADGASDGDTELLPRP